MDKFLSLDNPSVREHMIQRGWSWCRKTSILHNELAEPTGEVTIEINVTNSSFPDLDLMDFESDLDEVLMFTGWVN